MFFFYFWSHNFTQRQSHCFAIVFLQRFEDIAQVLRKSVMET